MRRRRVLEGVQPHIGQDARGEPIGIDRRDDIREFNVGQRNAVAEYADRQIAVAVVFAHGDQEGFDIARTEAVAEDQIRRCRAT